MDPLTTNLVVADNSRTEKTICLAVSPSLKSYGISGRPRLFEVIQKVNEINALRRYKAPKRQFIGKSYNNTELISNHSLELDYITATPRMALYMKYSTEIYAVYLKYIAPEDIHNYSIDEVFIDATHYLKTYKMTAHKLAATMIKDVLKTTGITATAGVGTNMYLAKVAMDIVAKHIKPDNDGVRIAELDEMSYRKKLWTHKPLTDFWRVGRGYAKKLEQNNMFTMGDIAKCSIGAPTSYYNEDLLYKLFGVNAELLIDHAWGWEPTTIAQVKAYKPENNCTSSGQVLLFPYTAQKARLVIREMAEALALDLLDKTLLTNQIVLTVSYDIENLNNKDINYKGEITTDYYGRRIPKHAHGTENLKEHTSSARLITKALLDLYDRIVDKKLLVRKLNITANHLITETDFKNKISFEQLDLFTPPQELSENSFLLEREKSMQSTILKIKKKYGKNAILKGTNLQEGATAMERNRQIGGHKA